MDFAILYIFQQKGRSPKQEAQPRKKYVFVPRFLRLSAQCVLPLAADSSDSMVLTDTIAIIKYWSTKYQDKIVAQWYPSETDKREKMELLLSEWGMSLAVLNLVKFVIFEKMNTNEQEKREKRDFGKKQEKTKEKEVVRYQQIHVSQQRELVSSVRICLDAVNRHLAKEKFLVGDGVTFADVLIAADVLLVWRVKWIGKLVCEQFEQIFPHIVKWCSQLQQEIKHWNTLLLEVDSVTKELDQIFIPHL